MTSQPRNFALRFVLIGILVAAVCLKLFYKPSYEASSEPWDRIEGEFGVTEEEHRERDAALRARAAKMDEYGIPRDAWSPPESMWLIKQQDVAQRFLHRSTVSLLVLPVQGTDNALATTERSLITRFVSRRIAQVHGETSANPDQVLQYLGVHRSTYPTSDILELARITGAQYILAMHARHDREASWTLSATLHDARTFAEKGSKRWADLSFSSVQPPSSSVTAFVDEIVEFATDEASFETAVTLKIDAEEFVFPESLEDLIKKANASPIHAAGYLQMLGSLHPGGNYNQWRINLFERSLTALQGVTPDTRYYRYFKARAYASIGQRPAAVAALGVPGNVHEMALLAALNGNLPELQALVQDLGTSVLDVMAWRDLVELEEAYNKSKKRDLSSVFFEQRSIWAPFIDRALRDGETYGSYNTLMTKLGLERLVPVSDESLLDELMRFAANAGVISDFYADRWVSKHIDDIRASLMNTKSARQTSISKLDILDLATAISVSNHIADINLEDSFRGRKERALELINKFEPMYAGHPEITLRKGRILEALAEKSTGAEQQTLSRRSTEALLNGFAWTGGVTKQAASVGQDYGHIYSKVSSQRRQLRYIRPNRRASARIHEWPRGETWLVNRNGMYVPTKFAEECIDYSSTNFYCLIQLIQRRQDRTTVAGLGAEELLDIHERRFLGHPARPALNAWLSLRSGGRAAEMDSFRAAIKAGSEEWVTYLALGRILTRQGKYKEAQEVWLSYPHFTNSVSKSRVTIDNLAGEVGSALYWVGQYELAEPLLQIADSGTGSGMNFVATQRLALINSDLREAAFRAERRFRRYDSHYGLRDLLQIWHAGGASAAAWELFAEVEEAGHSAPLWSAALVGHRVAGLSQKQIAQWAMEKESRQNAMAEAQTRGNNQRLAARHLLMAGTMDRNPDDSLADIVAALDFSEKATYRPARVKRQEFDRSGLDFEAHVLLNGIRTWHDPSITETFDEQRHPKGHIVETRHTMIAEAMTAFLSSDFDAAYELFDKAFAYYKPDEYLPYHCFSAAKLGQTQHLLEALQRRDKDFKVTRKGEVYDSSSDGFRFDEDLSYAVLAAFSGEHETAIARLNAALNNKPFLDNRSVYPMYALVDIADRLYEQTGQDAYKAFALELSRRHTVILPMYAWAYFVVAKHAETDRERVKAIASGLALDALSHRASQLPERLLKRGAAMLEKDGPPYLKTGRSRWVDST